MKQLFLLLNLVLIMTASNFAEAATYYIRANGGTSSECTGLSDADYDGSGTGEACAFKHPYYALKPRNTSGGVFVGGDTMIIGPGTYEMSASDPAAGSGSECNTSYAYDCRWEIPAGTAGNPTRILGKGYDTETGTRPVLRGAGNIYDGVITFKEGQDYITIEYIKITDNENCLSILDEAGTSFDCTGNAARYGIWNEYVGGTGGGNGSSNITLRNIQIYGMATGCVMFSAASGNWTIDNVDCRGGGMVGWDSDSSNTSGSTNDGQSGTFTVTDSTVNYIGCIVNSDGNVVDDSCVGQSTGWGNAGYGDAFGFADGSMGNWDITNLECKYNMSDCFDGLHGDGSGYVKIKNSVFVGNVGAAIKGGSPVTAENNIIIDDCAWHVYADLVDSIYKTGGAHPGGLEICRADASVSIQYIVNGTTHTFIGNTFFSNHDQILSAQTGNGATCGTLYLRNNLFYGGAEWRDDSTVTSPWGKETDNNDKTDSYYLYNGCSGSNLDSDYNHYYNSKDGSGDIDGTHDYYGDPGLSGTIKWGNSAGYFDSTGEELNFYLGSSSNARYENRGADTADETVSCVSDCSKDNNLYSRGANWDAGAFEYGSAPPTEGGTSVLSMGGSKFSLGGVRINKQ